MSRHCKHRLQKLCNSPSAQRRGKRLAARGPAGSGRLQNPFPQSWRRPAVSSRPRCSGSRRQKRPPRPRRRANGARGAGATAAAPARAQPRPRPAAAAGPAAGAGNAPRSSASSLRLRRGARRPVTCTSTPSASPPFFSAWRGSGGSGGARSPRPSPRHAGGDGSPAAPSEATRARLAPALVICASLSRSVSLCNPQGLAPRLVPSLRRRRRGRRGRRAVAVAAARDGACQRAAPRPPGGRLCSGGGRARAPSASTGPALSPPLPRQARARRRAADRGQGAGTARPARLRNFALRSGWHSRPRGLPRLPARRSPRPAPLGPALPPPARPAPLAADWLLGTLVAPPPGTGGGRESEPSESEALRRGDFFSILFFFFPFWSDLGRRQSNNSKRLPQNRWG